eukprot:768532-Hanusia_phi.AAC.5
MAIRQSSTHTLSLSPPLPPASPSVAPSTTPSSFSLFTSLLFLPPSSDSLPRLLLPPSHPLFLMLTDRSNRKSVSSRHLPSYQSRASLPAQLTERSDGTPSLTSTSAIELNIGAREQS